MSSRIVHNVPCCSVSPTQEEHDLYQSMLSIGRDADKMWDIAIRMRYRLILRLRGRGIKVKDIAKITGQSQYAVRGDLVFATALDKRNEL